MQKIATRVFIIASVTFGVLGTYIVLFTAGPDKENHGFGLALTKLFMISFFVAVTSFALSIAGKYLNDK